MRTGSNQGRLTCEAAPAFCGLCLFGALFDSFGHLGNRHEGARYLNSTAGRRFLPPPDWSRPAFSIICNWGKDSASGGRAEFCDTFGRSDKFTMASAVDCKLRAV
jgi:hypothetical protein